MTGEYQESHVDIPTSLQPVVVLVDGVGVHLHIDLLILQLRDVMNCLRGNIRISVNCRLKNLSYPPYLDWLVNLVVNNEVELFQHHVSLHHQVGQLRVQLKLLRGYWRLQG